MRQRIPGIKTTRITDIPISDKGIYIWVMPDGKPIMNDEADVLNVQCYKGDISAINDLRKKALHFGGPDAKDGTYKFIAGSRRLTDEEFVEELETMMGERR